MSETSQPRLKLTEVRLERFKATFKPPNPIDFQPFNVIIGRNGSGKSTVIEALQWIDTALRYDVRQACDPYNGVHDLVNLRSQSREWYFKIELKWEDMNDSNSKIHYGLKIREATEDGRPEIAEEHLSRFEAETPAHLILTQDGIRSISTLPGADFRNPGFVNFSEPDRLALTATIVSSKDSSDPAEQYFEALRNFWRGAVFLRLSPIGIAQGSRPLRKSFEPLLDQEGRLLPALLGELNADQRESLVRAIQTVLPDIKGVEITPPAKRRDEVFFSLLERMPYRGRSGRYQFPIPSWMLSEGTRRITAILALLQHDPPPTLLCIEEIENGLDPWSVRAVLKELRSASRRDIQVILTTHSPWLLDNVEINDILHVERQEGETVYKRFADRAEVRAYQGRVPPGAIYVTEG